MRFDLQAEVLESRHYLRYLIAEMVAVHLDDLRRLVADAEHRINRRCGQSARRMRERTAPVAAAVVRAQLQDEGVQWLRA